jgi:hypothetical protein
MTGVGALEKLRKLWKLGGRLLFASLALSTLLLTGSMLLGSLVATYYGGPGSIRFTQINNLLIYLLIIIFSCVITFATIYLYERRHHSEAFHVLRTSRFSKLLAVVFCALLAIFFILSVSMARYTGASSWDLNNPGALFVFVTGWLSVGGVYLTLQQVSDLRNSIVSFEDFIVRVTALIDDTQPDDLVKMLVLTPAMGCLVLEPTRWEKLTNKIQGTDKHIQLTALELGTMRKWFLQYLSPDADDPDMRERIEDGLEAASTIIGDLVRKSRPETVATITNKVPILGKWNDIPKTYLVANATQAIVCAPLFLPTPDSNPLVGIWRTLRVQMIGFESQDFHIVESVRQEIDLRRHAIIEAAAAAEQARVAAEVEAAERARKDEENRKVAEKRKAESAKRTKERDAKKAQEAGKTADAKGEGSKIDGNNVVPINKSRDIP